MKRFLRATVAPAIFLGLTVYFGYNAVNGSRGFIAQAREQAEIAKARTDLKTVTARRGRWEAKVAALKSNAIQADMLNQQARAVLNLANPADLVVPVKPGQAPGAESSAAAD
ncbi:MAG TPA: septum formation initiator family protein [Acetobacteraceae bacterium]|nr:septum formation initiator family protein [Acetobacteraceae bacterium]